MITSVYMPVRKEQARLLTWDSVGKAQGRQGQSAGEEEAGKALMGCSLVIKMQSGY